MKRFVKSPVNALVLLWATAWLNFFIFETHAWGSVLPMSHLWIILGLVFVALAVVARLWELQGGTLLIVCGLGLLFAYDIWPPRQLSLGLQVIIVLLLTVPPLLAGLLMIGHAARGVQ